MPKSKMTIDRAMKNAAAIVEAEGFTITKKDSELVKKIALGEMTLQDAIKRVLRNDD